LRSFANKKRYGRPPDQKILEYAKKNEIELIVRGTEHQKGSSQYISIHF
jgi:nucleotide-binding universal stress UspA family protein